MQYLLLLLRTLALRPSLRLLPILSLCQVQGQGL